MPFKSPPPKKGQLRRITLKFKTDLTRKQMANFRKSVRSLAKRFKASISRYDTRRGYEARAPGTRRSDSDRGQSRPARRRGASARDSPSREALRSNQRPADRDGTR